MGSIVDVRKATLYLMNAIAFLALQLSRELSPVVIPLYWAGMAVSWFWEPPRIRLERWAPMWTWVTIGVFAFTLIDVLLIGEFFLISAMNFVLFLATAKLFQRAEDKDYTQSMALSLLLLAAGAVLNDSLSFGVMFALYVVASTVGLTVQHLSVEITEHHGDRGRAMKLERAVLASTLALGVMVFAGSAAFFFAFPRIGFGFFVQQSREGVTSSGFTDNVELGNHGTIRENTTIVMRVLFPQGLPAPADSLYWRGQSLDEYDGRSWADNDDEERPVTRYDDGSGYAFDAWGRATASWEEWTEGAIPVEINLEPLDSNVLFALGRMRGLELPDALSEVPDSAFGRHLEFDSTGEVSLRSRSSMGVRYIAWSDPVPIAPWDPRHREWPLDADDLGDAVWQTYVASLPEDEPAPERPLQLDQALIDEVVATNPETFRNDRYTATRHIAEHYLQLPEEIITPRMAALADELRAQNPEPYQFALALQDWLQTNLTYTTDLPEPSGPGANLVDEFLFEWRRGHCEYFATAMVVLLRQQGIPARIVNGFLGADYNSVGEFYSVRQANAHSWVELNLGAWRGGWLQFDPTPAGAVQMSSSGWFANLAMFVDSLRLKWFRWVVEYDLEKQVGAARDLFEGLTGGGGGGDSLELMSWLRSKAYWLARNIRALSGLSLMIIAASMFYRRRGQARAPWGGADIVFAAMWVGLSLLLVWRLWHGGLTSGSLLAALGPPAIGVFIAWQLRRDLFDDGDGKRSRTAGSMAVSVLYTRLLRDIEREIDTLPLSVSADELIGHLPLDDRDVEDELDAFLAFYRHARFSGRPADAHQLELWQGRLPRLRRSLRRALREGVRRREAEARQQAEA